MTPSDVLNYVVIHEVVHRREPNHTQAFWSLVSDHDPEYEKHTMWLEEHSTRLIFSTDDLDGMTVGISVSESREAIGDSSLLLSGANSSY